MPPETIVEVDAADLRAIVQKLLDLEVDSRCHTGAAFKIQDPVVRSRLADDFDQAKPQAGDAILLRYRELMEALNSGKDIRAALAKFAQQEGLR
jgi:hypothetical protein